MHENHKYNQTDHPLQNPLIHIKISNQIVDVALTLPMEDVSGVKHM